MKHLHVPISAYLQIVRMGVRIIYAYRFNVLFQLLSVLFQIYLLKMVWTAIYVEHSNQNQLHMQSLIAYLTLANLQTWILVPNMPDDLQQRVRTGEVAFDITRPVNFIGQLLAQKTGTTLGLLPFMFIAFPLSIFVGEIQLPASSVTFLLYIISSLLAYLIVSFIGILIGLISFWTLETTAIQLIYRFVNQLFAGALFPISLFPPILHTIATFLPFQAIAFLPISIYLGQLQPTQVGEALFIQLIWVITLYLLMQFIWYKAQRYVMIQGG